MTKLKANILGNLKSARDSREYSSFYYFLTKATRGQKKEETILWKKKKGLSKYPLSSVRG